MFTGIIEDTGCISSIEKSGTNISYWVQSKLAQSLKVDQSLSHNGVCLTVEAIKNDLHKVTAIDETLQKTNLGNLVQGSIVNLERCMQLNGRLDGHIVQGHVDTTALCTDIVKKEGSTEFSFETDAQFATLMIEKGSITLNGISLTIFNVSETGFTVAIIPYTMEHTNLSELKTADKVNIEFDIIGKYVNRIQSIKR
ncbi:MAG TPA: riboflavin synthase [Ferruginibacter sp.]|nr:riboflavin synthase [Ferruginibacter sp.]HRE64680.1 riboflavin synthase [Ferruginibacter sp.]